MVETVRRFLDIKDDLFSKKLEWLLGYPQIIYQSLYGAFGMYGMDSMSEVAIQYRSPLRRAGILNTNLTTHSNVHVACLVMSMLLQLEKDGFVNLSDLQPLNLLSESYTSNWNSFVNSYYE